MQGGKRENGKPRKGKIIDRVSIDIRSTIFFPFYWGIRVEKEKIFSRITFLVFGSQKGNLRRRDERIRGIFGFGAKKRRNARGCEAREPLKRRRGGGTVEAGGGAVQRRHVNSKASPPPPLHSRDSFLNASAAKLARCPEIRREEARRNGNSE